MKTIFFVLLMIILSGCVGDSLDRSYSRSLLNDDELLQRILSAMVIPTSYRVYADDIPIEGNEDIKLEDVVYRNSSCVISELSRNATRMDLEVINALWVESDGGAKDVIIDTLGMKNYYSGVESYANATFDCGLVVSRWLTEMDN